MRQLVIIRFLRTRVFQVLLIGLVLATQLVLTPTAAQASTATFRILHASPDLAAVDVYVETTKVATLSFTQFSPKVQVQAGTRNVVVRPAGDPNNVLLTIQATFASKQTGTVVIAGRQNNLGQSFVLADLPVARRHFFRYRVVNLAPESGPIDLINISNRLIIPSIAFRENKFATLPSYGTYFFLLRNSGQPDPFLTLPAANFASQGRYTLWVFNTAPQPAPAAAARAVPEQQTQGVLQSQPGTFIVTKD